MNRAKLAISGLIKYLLGVILVGALVFLPAWTLAYPGAWIFVGVLFLPMLILGAVLLISAPELLAKRLSNKEKQKTQKGVVKLAGLMFIGGFVLCALDFRFGWSHVPVWLMITAAAVFLIGYAMYAEVMRENAYLSRTVEVQEGQKVVDTGLYGMVRHPMYLATLLMFLPMPLILQSLWGLCVFGWYAILIVIRIRGEEKLLSAELDGYAEYKKKVKYRLVPFIW